MAPLARLVVVFALCVPCGVLCAQGAGAPVIGTPTTFPELGPGNVGNPGRTNVSAVFSVTTLPIPASPLHYAVLTVRWTAGNTPPGGGGYDAMSGTWDPKVPGSFVQNTDVDHLNSAGSEFQPTVSPDLTTFVMDTGAVPIIATRAGTTGPFGTARMLSGVPSAYIDPNIGVIQGQLVLFFFDRTTNGIRVGDLDAANAAVTNVRDAILAPVGTTYLHSPCPIFDSNGETRMLLCAATTPGSGANAWFSSTPEFTVNVPPYLLLSQGTAYLANPGVIRGSAFYRDASPTPLRVDFFAMSSGRIPSGGGIIDMYGIGPDPTVSPLLVVNLGIMLSTPIMHPLITHGALGLQTFVSLPTTTMVGAEIVVSFPVPALPSGAKIWGQAISFDPATSQIDLSNTFVIE